MAQNDTDRALSYLHETIHDNKSNVAEKLAGIRQIAFCLHTLGLREASATLRDSADSIEESANEVMKAYGTYIIKKGGK